MTTLCRAALELYVRRLSLRSEISDAAELAVLSLPGEERPYPANRDFVAQGSHVTSACLVVGGRAGRYEQTADGDRQITAIHLPGDMADLHAAMIPRVSSGLQSLTRCTIYHVPHRAILDIGAAHPDLAQAFWRDTVADAFILAQWLLNNGRRSALARVAHLLCELAVRAGAVVGERLRSIDLQLTQVQIADALGLTSVHVNRMFRLLQDDGIVRLEGRSVDLLDWNALVRVGDFNPDYLHLRRN